MCKTVAEARAHALALLLGGYSPEEVEAKLEGPGCALEAYSALTDPTNDPTWQEVTDHGTPQRAG